MNITEGKDLLIGLYSSDCPLARIPLISDYNSAPLYLFSGPLLAASENPAHSIFAPAAA